MLTFIVRKLPAVVLTLVLASIVLGVMAAALVSLSVPHGPSAG